MGFVVCLVPMAAATVLNYAMPKLMSIHCCVVVMLDSETTLTMWVGLALLRAMAIHAVTPMCNYSWCSIM